jgi:hypothetical protein
LTARTITNTIENSLKSAFIVFSFTNIGWSSNLIDLLP